MLLHHEPPQGSGSGEADTSPQLLLPPTDPNRCYGRTGSGGNATASPDTDPQAACSVSCRSSHPGHGAPRHPGAGSGTGPETSGDSLPSTTFSGGQCSPHPAASVLGELLQHMPSDVLINQDRQCLEWRMPSAPDGGDGARRVRVWFELSDDEPQQQHMQMQLQQGHAQQGHLQQGHLQQQPHVLADFTTASGNSRGSGGNAHGSGSEGSAGFGGRSSFGGDAVGAPLQQAQLPLQQQAHLSAQHGYGHPGGGAQPLKEQGLGSKGTQLLVNCHPSCSEDDNSRR